MALRYEVAGEEPFEIEHLMLDVNGTLTDRGRLVPGVRERIGALRTELEVRLLSADTFGTLEELGRELGVEATRISTGMEKGDLVRELGGGSCAAIGNGRNDAEMLAEVRLGIVVLGPEGLSPQALSAARIVCPSITVALDLLADPRALAATLRR
jgi:soluble P-type ATPase